MDSNNNNRMSKNNQRNRPIENLPTQLCVSCCATRQEAIKFNQLNQSRFDIINNKLDLLTSKLALMEEKNKRNRFADKQKQANLYVPPPLRKPFNMDFSKFDDDKGQDLDLKYNSINEEKSQTKKPPKLFQSPPSDGFQAEIIFTNDGKEPPIGILGSLSSLLSKMEKKSPEKKDKEKEEKKVLQQVEYTSDDEFEELDLKLDSISDVIELGKLYNEEKVAKNDGSKDYFEMDDKKYSINLEQAFKLREPLMKLDSLIGLKELKTSILEMVGYYLQYLERNNDSMLHTVIEGPPGVGKTEVGRILGEIYASLGVLKSNKFKVVKRNDLVGQYLGHTAEKTQAAIDEAEGGVLFIDEAYSLGNEEKRDSFSKECIDTINQNLSENKKKFICIIAGYPDELEKCFFNYNPGLKRRFPFRYRIEKYDYEELRDIFKKKVADIRYSLTIDEEKLNKFFKDNYDKFENYGGDIENLITACKFKSSNRIIGKHAKLRRKFIESDIVEGFDKLTKDKKENDSKVWSYMYA